MDVVMIYFCSKRFRFDPSFNDFESMNSEMFKEVVYNFGKSDDDMIKCKNYDFRWLHMWFHD